MEEVFVCRPRLRSGLLNRDLLLRSVGEEGLTARESVIELYMNASNVVTLGRSDQDHTRDTPWRDDPDVGLEAIEGELKADLVISLARTPVRDVVAAFLVCDCHHTASDDWSRERSTEKVDVLAYALVCSRCVQGNMTNLIDTVSLERRVDELGDELLL